MEYRTFRLMLNSAYGYASLADDWYAEHLKMNAWYERNANFLISYLVDIMGDTGYKYTPTHTPFIHYFIYECLLNGRVYTFEYEGRTIDISTIRKLYDTIMEMA